MLRALTTGASTMRLERGIAVAGLVLLLAGGPAAAEAGFAVHNEGALARSTALPDLGEARVLSPGDRALSLTVDWTNEYVAQTRGTESLILDGETQRYAATLRYGVAPDLEIGLSLPLLVTGGGALDGVIENWHRFWGLPNGGRDGAPRDRLLYQVQRDGQTRLQVGESTTALGDIALTGGWQLAQPMALRALIKLPTGDSHTLTGGNAGAALWLDWDPFAAFGGRGGDTGRWFGFVSGGASLNDRSDVLPEYQEQLVGFGGLGVGYRLFRPLAVIAQFYAHTPLYSGTELDALKRPGGQLSFGGRWTFSARTALDLGFQEDPITNSSPDFSIHLGLNLH